MKTKENNFVKNSIKYLIPLIPVVLVAVMTGLLFDTYYDINDDSAIRNILSGVFSGEPSPMAVYVEYPFALILSLMYKIFPAIPWFGFIEHVMLYGSLYLVAFSLSNRTENKLLKIILSVFAGYIFEALLFYRIIYVQYTTVAGITAAAGAVGFLFSDDKADGKHFLISSIPCIICEVLAFCLRPNMMAVELPMIGVVYIVKWLKGSKENDTKCFNGKNIVKYFMPLFIVTALMALSFITNKIAYSTNGWKEYSRFNDARTTILDFQEFIPPYDENFDFYDSIGWEEVDTVIVRNYNIAVDDRITAENLEKLAEYNEDAHGLGFFKKGVKESLIYYKYKLTHTSEYKYAYGVIALYVVALALAIVSKDKITIIGTICLFASRSIGWMFIIMRGRFPERILIPLCFCEMIILISFILMSAFSKSDKTLPLIAMIVLAALVMPFARSDISAAYKELARRDEVNVRFEALKEYCGNHSENYYALDVMSTVAYSEKIYKETDTKYANYEICGGWLSNNPLYDEKLSRYDIANLSDALIEGKAYFVAYEDKDVTWIADYYKSREIEAKVTCVDSIKVGGETVFNVFSVEKVNDNE